MQKSELINIIRKKVKEHEKEMSGCQINIDALQTSLTTVEEPDTVKLAKLGILNSKMIFHKACKATLEDILDEINKR
jgi:nucleoid DNA-binding protein